jgi:hypothetical protein
MAEMLLKSANGLLTTLSLATLGILLGCASPRQAEEVTPVSNDSPAAKFRQAFGGPETTESGQKSGPAGEEPLIEPPEASASKATEVEQKAPDQRASLPDRPEPVAQRADRADTADRGARPAGPRRRSPVIEDIIRRLKNDRSAEKTFWDLTAIPERHIPELIQEVNAGEKTAVKRLSVFVSDRSYVQHEKLFLVSDIPGMGLMEVLEPEGYGEPVGYTKSSYNRSRNRQGYRVVIDRPSGFALGVVIRAGLVNRFERACKDNGVTHRPYPRIDHRRYLVDWWNSYYRSMGDSLRLSP